MKSKPSTPTPKKTTDDDEKIDTKPTRPSLRTLAAEELANELSKVSIADVAKIAAQLSTLEIAPFEAVDWAYTLLEMSAIAKSGLKKGYGFKFPLVESQNFPNRYGSSNLRWEELKVAFPEIEATDKSYRVPFVEGLSKLMGKNTKMKDRDGFLRGFMVQEAQNLWGDESLNQSQIDTLITEFKTEGISPSFFTSLWFYFPRWKESDSRAAKAVNARKRSRKARPPEVTEDEVVVLQAVNKLAQAKKKL